MQGGYLEAGADCRVGLSWVNGDVQEGRPVQPEGGVVLSTKLMTRAGRAYLKGGCDHLSESYFQLALNKATDALKQFKLSLNSDILDSSSSQVITIMKTLRSDAEVGLTDVKKYREALTKARKFLMATGVVKDVGNVTELNAKAGMDLLKNTVLSLSPGGSEGGGIMTRTMAVRGMWAEMIKFSEKVRQGEEACRASEASEQGVRTPAGATTKHFRTSHRGHHTV